MLAFMHFPKAHRTQIDDAAIVRLAGALLLEQNDEWQLQGRCMQLEGLKALSDNHVPRLSAVIGG